MQIIPLAETHIEKSFSWLHNQQCIDLLSKSKWFTADTEETSSAELVVHSVGQSIWCSKLVEAILSSVWNKFRKTCWSVQCYRESDYIINSALTSCRRNLISSWFHRTCRRKSDYANKTKRQLKREEAIASGAESQQSILKRNSTNIPAWRELIT
jgi:hypothetical protein